MHDYTDIGGTRRFQDTCWTELISAKTLNEDHRKIILGSLLEKYWKPVYCYLRRKGYSSEEAKDLTQGFFHEILIEKKLAEKADRTRGKFRSFLLKSLERYVYSIRDKESAQKRKPTLPIASLDHIDPDNVKEFSHDFTPENAFNYTWASEFLRMVYEDVKEACENNNLSIHWSVFNRRILNPILSKQKPPSLKVICEGLGIKDENQASNMIGVVKKRFRTTMVKHLRQLVGSEQLIDQEYNDLLSIFSKR